MYPGNSSWKKALNTIRSIASTARQIAGFTSLSSGSNRIASLYTYSVGAHEVFHDVMKHSLSGPSIISALWRAYLGLLESASNDMYGMALSLGTQHKTSFA